MTLAVGPAEKVNPTRYKREPSLTVVSKLEIYQEA